MQPFWFPNHGVVSESVGLVPESAVVVSVSAVLVSEAWLVSESWTVSDSGVLVPGLPIQSFWLPIFPATLSTP